MPEVLGSEAVAVTFASKVYPGFAAVIVPILVALSSFGAANGTILTSSRLFYAGAREGQMPRGLAMVSPSRSTPTPAVIITVAMAAVYLCVSDIGRLMNYVGFATWLMIGLSVACLPYLRWRRPEWERPIKVSLFFPAAYILLTLAITGLPIVAKPLETAIGFIMILSAVPVYFGLVTGTKSKSKICDFTHRMTIKMQKLLNVTEPTLEKQK